MKSVLLVPVLATLILVAHSSSATVLTGEERALRELASFFCSADGDSRDGSCVDQWMAGLEVISKQVSDDGLLESFNIRIASAGGIIWKLTYRNGELLEITLIDPGVVNETALPASL